MADLSDKQDREVERPEDSQIVAEHRDTLMERLADAIEGARRKAEREFTKNAALRSVGDEYDEAVATQQLVRKLLVLLAIALMLIAMFALDQRWPFLGNAWEFATPFEANRTYDAAIWPIGWFVVGGLVMAGGIGLLWAKSMRLLDKFARLEDGNADRHRLGRNATHYASELLRLSSMAEQFSDHRLIITEFLHRPFGTPSHAETTELSVTRLKFGSPPPPSMLVAWAQVVPEKMDSRHQQHQASAIEQGWLTAAYRDVQTIWRDRYGQRIVGEFLDPDNDTAQSGSVVYRDRRDGSGVFGARTDFALSIVEGEGEGPARDGWALRQAAANRLTNLLDHSEGGIAEYLELFGSLEAVHGSPAGIASEAFSFLTLGNYKHGFAWVDLLDPGADPPRVLPLVSLGDPYFVLDASTGQSLVLAWHVELSDPVRPQDQSGWRASEDAENPVEPHRPVV